MKCTSEHKDLVEEAVEVIHPYFTCGLSRQGKFNTSQGEWPPVYVYVHKEIPEKARDNVVLRP